MNITLKRAVPSQRDVLYRFLQYSLFEESLTDCNEMNKDALFDYPWFDAYFYEPEREAYLICDNEEDMLLGFAMINTYLQRAECGHSIAEFMIIPKYRHRGIGTQAAHACFLLHAGYWEVRPAYGSEQAYRFWKCAIEQYVERDYDWKDGIFSFDVPDESEGGEY